VNGREGHPETQTAFIVSCGRSGTTLLRVMLASHSRLFAPPELNLLAFEDASEMLQVLGPCPTQACAALGCDMVDGLRRAVMEALQLDGDCASRLVSEWAYERRSTRGIYSILSEAIRPKMLVDKSPLYTLRGSILARAERWFDEPLYVHLVRHPKPSILSRARDNAAGLLLRWATEERVLESATPFHEAELLWNMMTRNALEFLQEIPPDRKITVRFEELVTSPRTVLERICAFLEVPYEDSVLHPYEGNRMRDGVRKGTIAAGSREIHRFRFIDPGEASGWELESVELRLGEGTRRLARRIGYEL
jgi:Sulfotransferase family